MMHNGKEIVLGHVYDSQGNKIGEHEIVDIPRTPEFLRAIRVISVLDKYLSSMFVQAAMYDRIGVLTDAYIADYHYRKEKVLAVIIREGEKNGILRPILKKDEFKK